MGMQENSDAGRIEAVRRVIMTKGRELLLGLAAIALFAAIICAIVIKFSPCATLAPEDVTFSRSGHVTTATDEVHTSAVSIGKVVIVSTLVAIVAAVVFGYLFSIIVSSPVPKPENSVHEKESGRPDTEESCAPVDQRAQENAEESLSVDVERGGQISPQLSAQERLQRHVKHLDCFYALSKLIERPKISLEQIFQETTQLIRNAYLYPDVTCVRITFDGIHYRTDNFEKTELSQYVQINVRGEKAGDIEVYYLGEKPESGQGPFLEEERDLLSAIGEHLGRIAERTRAREKLQLFRNLIDRSNDCIFVIEPKWGRLLDVNDRACDSLGYTREELLRMTVKDIDESIPDDSLWQQQAEELKLKGDIVRQGQHKRKDTTAFHAEASLKLVSQGREDYIIAVARDITERKRAEEKQAELLEELEDVNRELKDFAHIVSHDLKAPLRGIKTLADWIATDYADKLDEQGQEQMNLLLARVGRMHNLIEGVLQYSRVGRVAGEKVQVDLNGLIPDVIDMVTPPKNIEITVENELPVVECEKTCLIQVFQNLISNAVKYMDKTQGWVRIGCAGEDGFWRFSVADNGPGIEEKHFERIFRIFQTLSPRDEFESTGIGLTVIKKIIELHNGRIWIESKVGEGSTFFFTLPKSREEVKDAKLEANIAC